MLRTSQRVRCHICLQAIEGLVSDRSAFLKNSPVISSRRLTPTRSRRVEECGTSANASSPLPGPLRGTRPTTTVSGEEVWKREVARAAGLRRADGDTPHRHANAKRATCLVDDGTDHVPWTA